MIGEELLRVSLSTGWLGTDGFSPLLTEAPDMLPPEAEAVTTRSSPWNSISSVGEIGGVNNIDAFAMLRDLLRRGTLPRDNVRAGDGLDGTGGKSETGGKVGGADPAFHWPWEDGGYKRAELL